MNKKSFSDIYEIKYKTIDDWNWFMEALDKIDYKKHIVLKEKNLPAPIEVLINEFNPNQKLEYRDILGISRTESDNINIIKAYLSYLNATSSKLIIVDRYFFAKLKDIEEQKYLDLVKKCFEEKAFNNIVFYTDKTTFSNNLFIKIKKIFVCLDTNIEIKFVDNIHDRFYLSDNNRGFSMGASLNGFLKREGIIQRLTDNDYNYLFCKYK